MLAFVFMMADCIGAWPGDHPKATRGIDISSAVLRTRLLTMPIQAVQMELARSNVAVEKISSRAVTEKSVFMIVHDGLNDIQSTPRLSVTALMLSHAAGATK